MNSNWNVKFLQLNSNRIVNRKAKIYNIIPTAKGTKIPIYSSRKIICQMLSLNKSSYKNVRAVFSFFVDFVLGSWLSVHKLPPTLCFFIYLFYYICMYMQYKYIFNYLYGKTTNFEILKENNRHALYSGINAPWAKLLSLSDN